MIVTCPYCNNSQNKNPIKSWKYGRTKEKIMDKKTIFVKSIKCSHYQCKCGKFFNFYEGTKSTWTIPKKVKA